MYKTKLFYKSMLIILSIAMGYFVSINMFAIPKIENSIHSLEDNNAKVVLNGLVSSSHDLYKNIEYFPRIILKIQRDNLKNLNHMAYAVLEKYYQKYKNKELSKKEAQRIAYNEIDNLRYGENGYFFIVDDNYKVIVHQDKNIQKLDFSKVTDTNGKFFVKEMIDSARVDNEKYIRYMWKKEDNKLYEKMSYVEKFEPWNIYVGTGVFIDGITLEVEKRKKELYLYLYNKIANTKISNSGYVYIINSNGDMLFHPNPELNGKNVSNIINPSRDTYLFDDLKNAYLTSKTLRYLWNKPEDKENYIYEKVSWIEYIEELDWYIVSAVYVEEFERNSKELKKSLVMIGFILLVISLLIASVLFEHLDSEIDAKTKELVLTQNKLKELANKDILTNLYNRRYLYNIVPKIISLAKREKNPLSVLMIDLDKFKDINDTYGHAIGDVVLKMFAEGLSKHTRDSDIVARVGGEEFVVLLNNTNKDTAYKIANTIREFTKKQNIKINSNESISITVSIGVDSVRLDVEINIDKALKRADIALYEAKSSGRDKVC